MILKTQFVIAALIISVSIEMILIEALPTTVRLVYPEDISVFYELYDCRLKIRKSFLTFFENLNTPMRIST